ncbi:hypothetical protein [cf. Phormidesmis sp. LEGE 11477]|uniref:hypothetical protein n=1 Tax=cf. Phormidesmis sp. LEGE 11477 TaxID=1828680 RepID=UPI00187E1C4A|nr:hypothetical protein [cf. Phormidesmis sp. LEGE 11477]MBE9063173.1 hypothetical protein [cf. Phormidesmis sp. LEGE 11477]
MRVALIASGTQWLEGASANACEVSDESVADAPDRKDLFTMVANWALRLFRQKSAI